MSHEEDYSYLLDQNVQGKSISELYLIPQGEYRAIISKLDIKSFQKKDGDTGLRLEIAWEIDEPVVREAAGRNQVLCKQNIFLELDKNGKIDLGYGNSKLGMLRESVGLNEESEMFNLKQLIGKGTMVNIKHNTNNKDGSLYAEVVSLVVVPY